MLLGTYESHLQEVLQASLNAGSVFYDVGAHHGYLSLLGCVLVGPDGHVYSFEPLPPNALVLQRMMEANHMRNHTLIQAAVSSQKGLAELHLGDGNDYRASLFPWKNGRRLEVETQTLDAFTANHCPPTLVKVDVEGAEALVLEGSAKLLSSGSPPTWVIEIHSEEADRAVCQIFEHCGYRCHYLPCAGPPDRLYPRHLVAEK